MARITSVRGMYNNVKTYEHICDTMTDMINIKNEYRTYGSICIVINGGADNIEIYTADSNNNWISIGIINGNPTTNELKKMINAIVENSSDTIDIVHTAGEYAEASEAWAVGTRNGAPIDETDLAYENNAKKYALDSEAWATGYRGGTKITDNEDPAFENNAKKYAMDAGGSAVAAMSLTKDAEAWANGTQNGQPISSTHPAFEKNAKFWSDHAFSNTPEGYENLVNKVNDLQDTLEETTTSLKKEKADNNQVAMLSVKTGNHEIIIDNLNSKIEEETGTRVSEISSITERVQKLEKNIAIKADTSTLARAVSEIDICNTDVRNVHTELNDIQSHIKNIDNKMLLKAEAIDLAQVDTEVAAIKKSTEDLKINKADRITVEGLAAAIDAVSKSNENETKVQALKDLISMKADVIQLAETKMELDRAINKNTVQDSNISLLQAGLSNMQSIVENKLTKPYGTGVRGQLPAADGTGGTIWTDPVEPSSEQIGEVVSNWLEEHPEATTTVENGSITMEKLSYEVQDNIENGSKYKDLNVLSNALTITNQAQNMIQRDIERKLKLYRTYKEKMITYSSYFYIQNGFGFLFFTDPHNMSNAYGATPESMLRDMEYIRCVYENTPAQYVICGGDWLNQHHYRAEALMIGGRVPNLMKSEICQEAYTVIGNHDPNAESPADYGMSDAQLANVWFASEKGYYIIEREKTDCYMLDAGYSNLSIRQYYWDELDWFAHKLMENTKPHLFACGHIIGLNEGLLFGEALCSVMNAFNNRDTITVNGETYNFSGCTGTFHFCVSGHYHSDRNDVNNNIPVFFTDDFAGSKAIDCCYADYDGGKMYMTRIGAGNDRVFNIIPTGGTVAAE